MDVEVLMKKGKRGAAAYIRAECLRSNPNCGIFDHLLDPKKKIDDWETTEWCRWLMAGGCTPDEFCASVRKFDNATTCGLVWTANFVAYRCRTCGISPCMSLCAECFQRGDHKDHDFNMFRSQAGGACDCGDTNVMKESGFCNLHGPHSSQESSVRIEMDGAPPDLLCVANAMMPRLFLRLIQHLRENSLPSEFLGAIESADKFITMLHDMSSMGAAMRQVMSNALTNPQVYKSLIEVEEGTADPEYYKYMMDKKKNYEDALLSLPNPEPPEAYKDIPSLQNKLVHRTFLEEFVFWTAKFEFPQKIVCLLLNLLPDAEYKEAFTRAFVLHYSRISQLLVRSQDPDMLSNRVVHVSVQLFSNEKLALRMTEQMSLLHVMVISLKYMMSQITIPCTLHDKDKNFHKTVDCGNLVMKNHCYWPLVSDLNNILSHKPVALKFLEDDGLLAMWFDFLTLFQGMNVNHRELSQHVEFEPTKYYAAFSAELEASASPMWSLVSHLKDAETAHLTKNLLRHCRTQLSHWLENINYDNLFENSNDDYQVSFHLPLHRYFSVFLYQAVKNQGLPLAELLPPPHELKLMILHPLRVQTAFYEIISGLWVRNGLQIKGQSMTYIQCHFCNSMVDADLFLLQVAMMNLPSVEFLNLLMEKFHLMESLSVSSTVSNTFLESDHEMVMMENCLILLSTLASIRSAIGMTDEELISLEMNTLLCMGEKTHSQLMELMPERCGNSSHSKDFEAVLSTVADYRPPFESNENMHQGMYVPKPFVWENKYDPIYILLRAVHRREFQTSLDRYSEFVRHSGKYKENSSPWPPFRIPINAQEPYTDPRILLISKVLHGMIFVILYKAVNTTQISEQLVSLCIYLLEMSLSISHKIGPQGLSPQEVSFGRYDMDFTTWFTTDCLFSNLRTEVDSVFVKSNASVVTTESCGEEMNVAENMEVDIYEGEDMFNYFDPTQTSFNFTSLAPDFPMSDHSNPPTEHLAILGPTSSIAETTQSRPESTPENSRGGEQYQLMLAPKTSRAELVNSTSTSLANIPKKEVVGSSGGSRVRKTSIGDHSSVAVVLNESIISLLLKLHSKYSGLPDSYIPFWEGPEAKTLITDALNGSENGLSVTKSESSLLGESYLYSYSQLYELVRPKPSEASIGDGKFFIKKLLDQISAMNEGCREHVIALREKLWPKEPESEEETRAREEKEREERKMKARERQKRLLAETTARAQEFMKHAMGEDEYKYISEGVNENSNASTEDQSTTKPIEYDCVICNLTSPSTNDNPMGLVILLQSSSTLCLRSKAGSSDRILTTCNEEDGALNGGDNTMKSLNEKRLDEFKRNFDDSSWLLSVSAGWEGGVHVQTCGHYLHMDCLKEYQKALRSTQRQHNISCDRGEYFCPFCRQLANSFLPLSPDLGIQSALVLDRKNESPLKLEATVPQIPASAEANVALEVMKLLREYPFPTIPCKMMDAMAKTMEEMTSSTIPKFRQIGSSKNTMSILLFINSIARTNLELEIVLRNGNLVSTGPAEPQPSTSSGGSSTSATSPNKTSFCKRSSLVPLLNVLGVHYKILSPDTCSPKIWERILGIRFLPDSALSLYNDREVPMLLRDPTSTLLHLLMQLPLHVDLAYFTSIVQGIYNLVYIQVLCSLSCRLSEKELAEWKAKTSLNTNSSDINQLYFLLGTVISNLEKSPIYLPDSYFGDMDNTVLCQPKFKSEMSEDDLEIQIQQYLLPFIRVASLLRHYIYDQELPYITSASTEFEGLSNFLELGKRQSSILDDASPRPDFQRTHNFLMWITPTPLDCIWTWCEDLSNFIRRAQFSARTLIESQHVLWAQPKLLELPHAYDEIFKKYHRKQCTNCNLVPKDPNICLVCGDLVCMRDFCCKQSNSGVCEAIQHSIDCGAGTAMFLSVNSSTIVVVRGKRACLWGSVYMDSYGEEDRDLKRGKPLFLSTERYNLLQQQWISHHFDHITSKKWIWHRDNL